MSASSCLDIDINFWCLMDFHSCPIVALSAIPSWDSQPKKWREGGYWNVANELWCKIDNIYIAFHEICLNTIFTRRSRSTQASPQDNMNTSSTVDIFNWHLMCITVETKHIGRVRISLTVKVAPIPVPSVRAPPIHTLCSYYLPLLCIALPWDQFFRFLLDSIMLKLET